MNQINENFRGSEDAKYELINDFYCKIYEGIIQACVEGAIENNIYIAVESVGKTI